MEKTILGIDLGTARMGIGVIKTQNNPIVLHQGIVSTISTKDLSIRLKDIYENLSKIVKKYNPNYIAIEDVFFVKNQKTGRDVASARGVVFLVAGQSNIPIQAYTPSQVKQSVAGYGQANKKQVQVMVQRLLSLEKVLGPDDVADALAVALCCAQASKYSELISNKL